MGEPINPERLFSLEKRKEIDLYFKNSKRGTLARILKIGEWGEMGTAPRQGLGGRPQGRAVECRPSFEAASGVQGHAPQSPVIKSSGARADNRRLTGGCSSPAGGPRHGCGCRKALQQGIREPCPCARGTGAVPCPISTTLLPGGRGFGGKTD